ncbi:MAG: hypothetical protein ACMUIL_07690 [bacterium]
MAILKIAQRGKRLSQENRIREGNILEGFIDDKIAETPQLLGEPLMLIGRQVGMHTAEDKLDFLALDVKGNAVLVEVKRSLDRESLEIRSLRYAAHLAKWTLKEFEAQAKGFLARGRNPGFDFNRVFTEFCKDAGIKKIPPINQEQRIIVTGSLISDSLVTYALWLRKHAIDVTIVELQAFKDEGTILIQPDILVPAERGETSEAADSQEPEAMEPAADTPDAKWREWHLEKRCSPQTKAICVKLERVLREHFDVEGPLWEQKSYIMYRINNAEWLYLGTTPDILRLDFTVREDTFTADDIAKTLKIERIDSEEMLIDEAALPSCVFVKKKEGGIDQIQLRIREDVNVESDRFLVFLEEAYRAFPR